MRLNREIRYCAVQKLVLFLLAIMQVSFHCRQSLALPGTSPSADTGFYALATQKSRLMTAVCLLLIGFSWSGIYHFASGEISADDQTSSDEAPIRVAPKVIKPATVRVGQLFPAVKLKSVDGRTFDLESCSGFKVTVIAATSTSCPLCKKFTPILAELEKEYSKLGVQFCFLNTLTSDSAQDIAAAIKTNSLKGPYIHDKQDRLGKVLGLRTTTEVFVFDSARTLVYRGAVSDQFGLGYAKNQPKNSYLADALDSLLKDQPITTAATTAPGCDLPTAEFAAKPSNVKQEKITWHNQVSRIVQSQCVQCHREKGLAPFALESPEDVIAHAEMIKTVIKNGTMPPWFAKDETEANDGQETATPKWANERRLSPTSKKNLLAWIDSDHALGDPKQAPIKKVFKDEWNIGTPDKIVKLPRRFPIQATGFMPYKHTFIRLNLTEDKWIKGIEIRPTDPAVVHHVLVFIKKRGEDPKIEETSGFFAAYVPGNSYQVFPEGFAKKLPAGSSLIVQLHYTPNGTATFDQTKIGFKYLNKTPKHIIKNKGIVNRRIYIPAGEENHREVAKLRIPVEAKLMSFMPHMHLRGKAFRYDLISSGERTTLLDVPRYDFNWQIVYRLRKPINLKRGDRIEAIGWYDNSENNPANPDPEKNVSWGDQTHEEMMLGYIEYYLPNEIVEESKSAEPSLSAEQIKRLEQEKTARIAAFKRYDKDGNGKVTKEELNRPVLFSEINANEDDHLTLEEVLQRVEDDIRDN